MENIAPDDIFDKCLNESEDGWEFYYLALECSGYLIFASQIFPDQMAATTRQKVQMIHRALDLAATVEDHSTEGGLRPDFTMVPGNIRDSLPLIKRFNRHGEQILRLLSKFGFAMYCVLLIPKNLALRIFFSDFEKQRQKLSQGQLENDDEEIVC